MRYLKSGGEINRGTILANVPFVCSKKMDSLSPIALALG